MSTIWNQPIAKASKRLICNTSLKNILVFKVCLKDNETDYITLITDILTTRQVYPFLTGYLSKLHTYRDVPTN